MTTNRRTRLRQWPLYLRLLMSLLVLSFIVRPVVTIGSLAAIPFSNGDQVTVTTDVLNVRSVPGTQAAIVDRLYEGESVTICAVDGWATGYDWVQVSRIPGNPIGWVAAEFLGYASASVTGPFAIGDRVLIDASAVNFRTGPTTSATVIRPLAYGTLLTLTDGPIAANGYTWYQGKTTDATGGDVGWAIGEAMMRAPADMPDPCLQYDSGSIVHVKTDLLRLRNAPSTSGVILATLPFGTSLTVAGGPVGADGYTWYPVVTTSGISGWVASTYLAGGGGSDTAGTLVIGSPARVDTAILNLRNGPGISATIQGQLSGGTWLMLVSGPHALDGYHWYQVETANSVSGWVVGEALVPAR